MPRMTGGSRAGERHQCDSTSKEWSGAWPERRGVLDGGGNDEPGAVV